MPRSKTAKVAGKVCWYCHDNTMLPTPELPDTWLKCTKCGATLDTKPLKVKSSPLIEEPVGSLYPGTKYRPRARRLARTSAPAGR